MEQELGENKLSLISAPGWPLQREFAVVTHREKIVSRALGRFLDIATECFIGRKVWRVTSASGVVS